MLRIGRLTDYGIVLMGYFAAHSEGVHTAAEAGEGAHLPLPTVSKLLRELSHAGLLESHRGVKGGYTLTKPASDISVADIITALEGPIAMTACIDDTPGSCDHESTCAVRGPWQTINGAIRTALEGVTLADMATSAAPKPETRASKRAQHSEGPTP